jgi:hypothetical protein
MDKLLMLLFCHLVGDYILQTPFIAETKGTNWYHLFVHCVLYCLPFFLAFGVSWHLAIVFASHIIVDPLKARYKILTYWQDQLIHYIVLGVYLT